jgi:hypothetical protein
MMNAGPMAGPRIANCRISNQRQLGTRTATHIYVFINLRGNERADYCVVPSGVVAKLGRTTPEGRSIFYSFWRKDAKRYHERWSIFGRPLQSS